MSIDDKVYTTRFQQAKDWAKKQVHRYAPLAAGVSLVAAVGYGCIKDGDPCTEDPETLADACINECVDGTCALPGTLDDNCYDLQDCAAGYVCDDYFYPKLCKSDDGCDTNWDCWGYGDGINTCFSEQEVCVEIAPGSNCDDDNDCPPGYYCGLGSQCE